MKEQIEQGLAILHTYCTEESEHLAKLLTEAMQHVETSRQTALEYIARAKRVIDLSNDLEVKKTAKRTVSFLYYSLEENDSYIMINQELLEIALKTDDRQTEVNCYHNLGNSYWHEQQIKESQTSFLKGLERFNENCTKDLLPALNRGLGITYWKQGEYTKALNHYKLALDQYMSINDEEGSANIHNYMGIICKSTGDIPGAQKHYTKALQTFTKLKKKQEMAKILNNLGNLKLMQGSNYQAIKFYLKAMKIAEESGNERTLSSLLNNTGLIFNNMNEWEQGAKYLEQALKIRRKLNDKTGIAHSLKNAGFSYINMGKTEQALQYSNKALEIELELDDKVGLATTYSLLGRIFQTRNNEDKALNNFLKSLELYKRHGDRSGITSGLISIGIIYLHKGDLAQSKAYLREGLSLAREIKSDVFIRDCFYNLYELSKHEEDYYAACRYFEKFIEQRDKVEGGATKREIADLQAKYDIEKREREAEIYRLKNIELANANQELTRLKEHLEEKVNTAIEEIRRKDTLMLSQTRQAEMGKMIGFIAHQWKQPLNSVGLLAQNLEDSFNYGELSAESLRKFTASILEQVQYMSKTIDDFRNFFRPESEKMQFDVKEVIERTFRLVRKSFDDNDITIKLDLCEACTVWGFPSEFSQVVINLLNNSRDALENKPRGEKRLVVIKLAKTSDKVILDIEDNGAGIKTEILKEIFTPYFTTKHGEKGSGLGLYISKTIIEDKMKGSIAAENTARGAKFKIVLKAGK